jgi:hypothetical protein
LWTLELADATILAKPRSLPTQVLTVCRARHYLHTPICRYKVLDRHNGQARRVNVISDQRSEYSRDKNGRDDRSSRPLLIISPAT